MAAALIINLTHTITRPGQITGVENKLKLEAMEIHDNKDNKMDVVIKGMPVRS